MLWKVRNRSVHIGVASMAIDGDLDVPQNARGVILFAHGSGSSRHSPRNRFVAHALQARGFATLLVDLLTRSEEETDARTARLRFDIPLLASRLGVAMDWVERDADTRHLTAGLFGASTGAGAALIADTERPGRVAAIVSRGGRPDLAGALLRAVVAPTLLIVGAEDAPVLSLNREAFDQLRVVKRLDVIPGASHLFEEPDALETVIRLALDWFEKHMGVQRAA